MVGLMIADVVAAVAVSAVVVLVPPAKEGALLLSGVHMDEIRDTPSPGAESEGIIDGGKTGAECLVGGSDDWVPYSTHCERRNKKYS